MMVQQCEHLSFELGIASGLSIDIIGDLIGRKVNCLLKDSFGTLVLLRRHVPLRQAMPCEAKREPWSSLFRPYAGLNS